MIQLGLQSCGAFSGPERTVECPCANGATPILLRHLMSAAAGMHEEGSMNRVGAMLSCRFPPRADIFPPAVLVGGG